MNPSGQPGQLTHTRQSDGAPEPEVKKGHVRVLVVNSTGGEASSRQMTVPRPSAVGQPEGM